MKNVNYPMNLQLIAEGDPNPADPQPKAFSQDEVDRLIADRLKRERNKYADYDELKAKVTENEKAEEERKKAELSVTERLEAERAEALERAQKAEQAKEAALTAANQRLIKAEFKAIARELNVRTDALEDAYVLANLTSVSVDDNDNPVGVEDAVKALLTNKPYLVDVPKKPQPIGDDKPNPGDEERRTPEQQLSDAKKSKDFAKVIEVSNKLSK